MNPNPRGIHTQVSSAQLSYLLTRFILWAGAIGTSTATFVGIDFARSPNLVWAEPSTPSVSYTNQASSLENLPLEDRSLALRSPQLGTLWTDESTTLKRDRLEQKSQFALGEKSFDRDTRIERSLSADQISDQFIAQSITQADPQSGTQSNVQSTTPKPSKSVLKEGSLILGSPYIRFQGAYVLQGDESSARARFTGLYPVTPNVMFGAEVDLTTGNGFSDSVGPGLSLNELYVAVSPKNMPNLRFIGGLMDLTSYFDRNSFAKDSTTHFFNRVFQTNPALSAAGIASRPGALINWSPTDFLDLKAAGFSSSRNLGSLSLDSFAGEVAVRFGTAIIRGTYVTSRDAGQKTGFEEIFSLRRTNGQFGLNSGDREEAYGINGEYYIPSLKLGIFGRYGRYNNLSLGRGGNTYSFGVNLLDVFMPRDRLGIGYGRQLSNDVLRQELGNKVPDVLEVFYDFPILPNLRAGVTFQQRNQFSETVAGFRIKTEFDVVPFRRPFR